jgi:hypothetical protein
MESRYILVPWHDMLGLPEVSELEVIKETVTDKMQHVLLVWRPGAYRLFQRAHMRGGTRRLDR